MKVGIIGTGYVGSTTAFALIVRGLVSELVLIDVDKFKAEGEALDILQATSFTGFVQVYAGDYSDLKDAQIVIISAGPSIKKGESRLELAAKNYVVFQDIVPKIMKYNDNCILLVVTNPVDVLSYITYKLSGLSPNKVIGSGTVLDSQRFRAILSSKLKVDPRNVHAYILGEHGDSQVAAWSMTNIMGITFDDYCMKYFDNYKPDIKNEIQTYVRTSAYKIIERKGATNYAVALAIAKIVKSILTNQNSIMTVSTYMENLDGIEDVYLSLPCIVNNHGIEKVILPLLSNEENQALKNSARIIKKYIDEVKSL